MSRRVHHSRHPRRASRYTPAIPHVWNGTRMVQAAIIDAALPVGQRYVIPSYQWAADAFTLADAALVRAETDLAEAVTRESIAQARKRVARARVHRDACGDLLVILPGVLHRRSPWSIVG